MSRLVSRILPGFPMNYDELTKTSLHIVQDYGLTGIFKDQKQNLVKQHAPAKQ